MKGEQQELVDECRRACGMIGHQEEGCFNIPIYQEQNPIEVHAMNAPPNGYSGFYNHNPNARWSHPSFNYKNNVGIQNPSSYPKQQV